jgi:hypothetical protein
MAGPTGWFKKNASAIITVLISGGLGLLGAYIGAYFGAATQTELWQQEKVHVGSTEIMNKRVEIYRNIAIAEAERRRMFALGDAFNVMDKELADREKACAESNPTEQTRQLCEKLKNPEFLNFIISANKDMAEITGRFVLNAQLAGLYFCDKTREELKSWDGGNWWERQPADFLRFRHIMIGEFWCAPLQNPTMSPAVAR